MSRRRAREAEGLTVIALLGTLLALTVPLAVESRRSAWASEVEQRTLAMKIDSVERFAITGRWLQNSTEDPELAPTANDRRSELEELGIEFRTRRDAGNEATSALTDGAPSYGRPTAVRLGVADGAIVAIGRLGAEGPVFTWMLRPTVQEIDAPMTVVWLCGAAPAPPGWRAAGGADLAAWPGLRGRRWCGAGAWQ